MAKKKTDDDDILGPASGGRGGNGRRLKKDDNKPPVDPTTAAAGGRIKSFVERVEQLDSEIKDLQDDRKDIFAEAKGEGFDAKVLKELLKIRKQDQDERDEFFTLVELYQRAMEEAD